jgi:acetylornithine/succinyldiaminopimelate/putrescine aminotransferase
MMGDSFERFVDALVAYQEAERELRDCVQSCQYDASYFCSSESDRVEEARKVAERAFKDAVVAVVA